MDKDGALAPLLRALAAASPPAPPTPAEVQLNIADFWYDALRAARKLHRGELLVATTYCDVHLKDLMLQVAAWHAGADPGRDDATWHRGRFSEEWADPRVVAGLGHAYAHYAAADVARALQATIGLFRWLACEAADHLGHPYPGEMEERSLGLVAPILYGEGPPPSRPPGRSEGRLPPDDRDLRDATVTSG